MLRQADFEGYLEIDHRESPGFTEEQARAAHWGHTMPVGSRRFQLRTRKCSNCERQVVLNPQRERERHYCPKCDAYHCDDCALATKLTGRCVTMKQRIDEFMGAAARSPAPLILP